ncbi:hypothetical protein MUP56_02365, partial [Patescibacteria group bacterium]|nr:hypothetical protein [Patescibacteria group bacterium]
IEIEPGTKLDTAQDDGYLPHHYFTEDEIRLLMPDYRLLHINLTHPQMVTAKGIGANWEAIFQKK